MRASTVFVECSQRQVFTRRARRKTRGSTRRRVLSAQSHDVSINFSLFHERSNASFQTLPDTEPWSPLLPPQSPLSNYELFAKSAAFARKCKICSANLRTKLLMPFCLPIWKDQNVPHRWNNFSIFHFGFVNALSNFSQASVRWENRFPKLQNFLCPVSHSIMRETLYILFDTTTCVPNRMDNGIVVRCPVFWCTFKKLSSFVQSWKSFTYDLFNLFILSLFLFILFICRLICIFKRCFIFSNKPNSFVNNHIWNDYQ